MLACKKHNEESTKQKVWSMCFRLFAFCFHLSSFIFLLFAFCFSGCREEFKKSNSGLEYKFIHQTNGRGPKNGEYLILDLRIKTRTDSVIYSSADAGMLFPVRYDTYRLKVGQKSEMEEGFFMMHEGDSAIFSVKTSDVYAALNAFHPKSADDRIYCHAKLVSILDYGQYSNWKSGELAHRQNENDLRMKKALEKETLKIDSALHAQHESFAVTGSGIRYIIEKPGTGSFPQHGDSVFFRYDVAYLDGTTPPDKFRRSGDRPKSFVMGSKGVFESWQESIALLKKGGAGRFYIPSPLAFGASQASGIKPDAILVVNIQLADIKKVKNGKR
jgi:FKBP-type peptidyl-prolyl cis-trans isomerase